MNQQHVSILSEEDLASTVLSDLKRVVREYATAATESTCPMIRQMFTDLLNSTLTMQGQLFQVMSQLQMYDAASQAAKSELNKQYQAYQQTQQQTNQWVSSHLTSGAGAANMHPGAMGQSQNKTTAQQANFIQ